MKEGFARRRAGISVPLFSLRSRQSWGIGEIPDIAAAASWLRSACQSVVQILPLNELAPGESSPYSALSAMAIDPRYISIRRIPDAPDFEALWSYEISELRGSSHIDYRRVDALKRQALRICFDHFHDNEWEAESERAGELREYVSRERWWLDEYALYRALRSKSGERPWTEWDAPLRDREASALSAARSDLAQEILFYQYVQWIADTQWQSVRQEISDIEVLGDFPFMVTLDSADVWSRQGDFVLDASVGTPPDAFSETGHEWGLPAYDWHAVRANDFEWLRQRARRTADLYDGFRVDHLVCFYRTYIRPLDGRAPYFSPANEEEQRALGETILALMTSSGADVSVEDLGTVPLFVRESVATLGLSGYRVFRWEPLDPATYPAASIAMTGTHDTETLAVWWESLPDEDRRLFAEMPSVQAPNSRVFDPAVRDAIVRGMYLAGSTLVQLPIQDVFGWRDRVNHPATIGDWNWTWVLPWPVDKMAAEPEASEAARRLTSWCNETGR